MVYYVIIRGPLGIGKSTIARKLASILNGGYISVDDVLEEQNLDKIDEKEGCIPIRNFIKANKFILEKIKNLLENSKIVIFDGNFYHKEQIENLIANLKYKHHIFTLKAPLKICIERDRKRGKVYGKEATNAVYKLVSRFDYGIIIDTNNKTAEEVVKDILSHLPKPE